MSFISSLFLFLIPLIGIPLLIHGEVTDTKVNVFDREKVFIEKVLTPLVADFCELKIVLEHISTKVAVDFISNASSNLAATITPQHILLNRHDLFNESFQPHNYCLPVAKRERHRLALREAATSGDPYFFLGTDSAPHSISSKETHCGCAGIFSAPSALELYAKVFEEEGAIENFENFASVNGPIHYGLDPNIEMVTMVREEWVVPERIVVSDGTEIKPFMAGSILYWKLKEETSLF